jgi:hypothetical protein
MLHRVRTHPQFVEGCFGCKASTLTVLDGQIREVAHRNDKELTAYADARRQGIQPRSTRLPDIKAATRASDIAGRAVQVR